MPTLFVEADEPLIVFPSLEDAERYLEREDVEAGVYPRAYDSAGKLYDIAVNNGRVSIVSVAGENDPAGLSRLLRRYLAALDKPVPSEANLESLVSMVLAEEEAFWAERDPYGERYAPRLPLWGCSLLLALAAGVIYLLLNWLRSGN